MGSRPSSYVFTQEGSMRLYSTPELLNLPAPTWLIDGVLPNSAFIALYGAPSTRKTFIALDIALSIASGKDWQGKAVEKGFVIYISAEGGSGIGKRVLAWLVANDVDRRAVDIAWVVESMLVNPDSEQLETLSDRILLEVRREPTFIVIDTLARCFAGDENQQEDMNHFVAGVDVLRKRFNCAVMVVHHTNLGGDRERGNTSFRGAADTMLFIKRDDDISTVSYSKQKDHEEFEDLSLELVKVDGTDSCVVQSVKGTVANEERMQPVIDALLAIQPARYDDWFDASGITKSQFCKYFAILQRTKRIRKGKAGWELAPEQPV